MKIRLFQILEDMVLRKSKGLQYYSGLHEDKTVNIKEKREIQTRLI